MLKPIPHFADEAEERMFWKQHDTFDYLDWTKVVRVTFPKLRRSTVPEEDATSFKSGTSN